MGKGEEVRDAIISEGLKGVEKTAEKILSQGEAAAKVAKSVSEAAAETVITQGPDKIQGFGIFFGNLTKSLEDSSKGAFMVHSGKRAATTGFKATKDFNRGDPVCGTLCTISSSCELVSGVLVWVPFPGKIFTVSCLKSVSVGCEKIRDMCAADPSSPMC